MSMMEKLARAMAGRKGTPWERRMPTERREYIEDVRSILLALRELDEGVVEAAFLDAVYAGRAEVRQILTAAIDHLLSSQHKGEE